VTAAEWVKAFCEEIGETPPTEAEFDEILKLASVAAHASERMAAPVACYIAGRSGRPLPEMVSTAEGLEP
jgi:Domain of unknown function (DUF6457)